MVPLTVLPMDNLMDGSAVEGRSSELHTNLVRVSPGRKTFLSGGFINLLKCM